MKECKICHKMFSKTKKGAKCPSCQVNLRRFARKDKAIEYKGGKCQSCGYSKCKAALVFHHVDPSTKSFGISGNHSKSWIIIQAELDKCILLCHNCHAEIHWLK